MAQRLQASGAQESWVQLEVEMESGERPNYLNVFSGMCSHPQVSKCSNTVCHK